MNAFLIIFLSALNIIPTFSDTVSIDAEIDKVIVFRQQAQIEHQQEVELKAGRNIIVFKNLSPTLNHRSIQLQANGSFTILSLNQKFDYFNQPNNNPDVLKLTQQLEAVKQEIKFSQAELAVIERETGLLGNSSNIINNNHLSAAELSQLLDLYRERASKLEKEKITLQNNIQEKQNELNKIQAQIQELSRGQQNRFAEVVAEVQSDTDQALIFELTYLVRNAGWNPSYDIRGTDTNAPLSLNYKAGIYQNTGVDWDNVSLTVSSGNPSLNSTLPAINPHFIGFRENEIIQTKQRAYDEMAISSYSDGVMLEAEMAPNPVAQFNQNQTSFSYTIENPYSVPSNGNEYTVGFRQEELPAKYIYATIPRFSEKAYLTANINDWDEFDLIPGQASIYFDNAYVGSTSISTDSFDDSLQVSLGVDQGIIVERKKLREYSENTFFGNKVEENYAWEINLRNNKDSEINIDVKDLIPISKDEDIEVEKINLSKGDIDTETGIITWIVKLDPGQSKSIKFSYKLRYPKGRELSL